MRKIGLIGGMSWVSTASYYTRINRIVQNRLGGFSSPHMLIESVNSGATAVLICSNAMHKIYDRVQPEIGVPILHIADCVGDKMVADGIKSATLVGTRNVMTEGFYRKRLVGKGITLSPPDEERVEEIDRIIYEELMFGQAKRESERTMKTYITNIAKQEIEAIVLGCTELDLIVDTKANILPIYDSTEIHADAAIEWILADG